MLRISLLSLVALVWAPLAFAQSVPNGGNILTPGLVWTPEQWMIAWQSKVDLTNGVLNNPTITGGTLNSPTLTNVILNSPIINSGTLSSPTVTGGILSGPTVTSPAINGGTISGLPTSCSGHVAGTLWNNNKVLSIC